MHYTGQVYKLISKQTDHSSDIEYSLPIGDDKVDLNPLLGKAISIRTTGEIRCINCNRLTKTSFSQGHCFPCMKSLASCDTCIIKPEQCHFHEGTCREPDWGEKNCFADHYVYLSNTSSGVKIGITRGTQVPTRWIDQGAVAAMPIYRVANRRLSGLIEHPLASFVSDKTNWRTMLKGDIEDIDLKQRWQQLKEHADPIAATLRAEHGDESVIELDEPIRHFQYPVLQYPVKVSSHNLDKTGEASGELLGIKGQYLIMDTGVLNIRKYTGYILGLEHA